MQIQHREVICLVDAARLQRLNAAKKGYIRDPLWREVRFYLEEDGCRVELGSVDEEAAQGGYCRCWWNTRRLSFTWPDLDDKEFLHGLLAHEQHQVARKVLDMLEALREGRVLLRKALSVKLVEA